MKKSVVFVLFILITNMLFCEDPFAKGRSPSFITTLSWGQLTASREKYHEKVISIRGCIYSRVKNGKIYFRLFRDQESYQFNKPLEYIELPDADVFCAAIDKNDFDKWKLLDGRNVELWGELKINDEDLTNDILGNLRMPYLIRVFLKDGEELVLQDKQAKWK